MTTASARSSERREVVLARIGEAAERAGRDPAGVTLVAVSKTHPADVAQAAIDAGLTVLGENRVQEAVDKVAGTHGGTWHLIGPLQANKARKAIEAVDVIESVDSLELARRLDRIAGEVRPGARLPVLLQVNVADDPTKAGFTPDGATEALDGAARPPEPPGRRPDDDRPAGRRAGGVATHLRRAAGARGAAADARSAPRSRAVDGHDRRLRRSPSRRARRSSAWAARCSASGRRRVPEPSPGLSCKRC